MRYFIIFYSAKLKKLVNANSQVNGVSFYESSVYVNYNFAKQNIKKYYTETEKVGVYTINITNIIELNKEDYTEFKKEY